MFVIQIPLVALSNGPTLDLLLRIDLCFPLITPTQIMALLQPKMTHRAGNAEQIIVGPLGWIYCRSPIIDAKPPEKTFWRMYSARYVFNNSNHGGASQQTSSKDESEEETYGRSQS